MTTPMTLTSAGKSRRGLIALAAGVVATLAVSAQTATAGAVELTGGDPGQAAAHLAARERDVEARGREDPHRGVAHGRREVLGERVRPQDDLATVRLGR